MQNSVKTLFTREDIKKRFEEVLGKRAPAFITSVLQIVNANDMLKDADPVTVLNAAATAASMDLPLNQNLGFAYIVPYNVKQSDGSYRTMAQFQLGYKGFIQLAQRSGQFLTISSATVYEGQLIESNPLAGFKFDWTVKSDKVIGFVAYFKLINGFEKQLYMTVEQAKAHGVKYSQTFKKGFGLWKTDFEAMAHKTVLKLLLSRYAPLSIEMQKAIITDQAIVNDIDGQDVTYADNEVPEVDKELERIRLLVEDCKSSDDLATLKKQVGEKYEELPQEINQLFINKLKTL